MSRPSVDYWLNGRHCMPISVEVANDFEATARRLGHTVERTPYCLKIEISFRAITKGLLTTKERGKPMSEEDNELEEDFDGDLDEDGFAEEDFDEDGV